LVTAQTEFKDNLLPVFEAFKTRLGLYWLVAVLATQRLQQRPAQRHQAEGAGEPAPPQQQA